MRQLDNVGGARGKSRSELRVSWGGEAGDDCSGLRGVGKEASEEKRRK